jgi:hypothetical protein
VERVSCRSGRYPSASDVMRDRYGINRVLMSVTTLHQAPACLRSGDWLYVDAVPRPFRKSVALIDHLRALPGRGGQRSEVSALVG